MMPGSTSFTGTLREKGAVRLVLCPLQAYSPSARGQCSGGFPGIMPLVSASREGTRGAALAGRGRRARDRGRGGDTCGKTEPRPTGSEQLWEPQGPTRPPPTINPGLPSPERRKPGERLGPKYGLDMTSQNDREEVTSERQISDPQIGKCSISLMIKEIHIKELPLFTIYMCIRYNM